ncbi:MAG TPA: membrane dipeptidase [Candidatus Krumholzibacteria bacterium]|nr:membrane dipeptidase [Candidatus Krumholzibacteria bacterium]
MRLAIRVLAVICFLAGIALYGVRAADRFLNAPRRPADRAAPGNPVGRPVPVVDLHTDALLWDRPLLERASTGQVDLPRLREGHVILEVFSATNSFPLGANYRRTPPGPDLVGLVAVANHWPSASWDSPLERALAQAAVLHRTADASHGRLRLVTSRDGLPSPGSDADSTAAILSIEGLHGLHDGVAAVDRLFAAGFRIFGLAHMTDNAVAGSAHGWRKGGLTPFGYRVVARIDSLGGIVDLAHASASTITDVLATGATRVMVSHTGVDGTCPGNRNLSDGELRAIAATGGIVGIGFWKGAVCGDDLAAIARAIRHAADVAGADHVALGSDFDGAVRTPVDAAGIQQLVPALRAAGFSASEIAAIMGGNAIRFLERTLPPGD